MMGPWPVTLITWNTDEASAEPPVLEAAKGILFKGPGGLKGPNYLAVIHTGGNAAEIAKTATPNPSSWTIKVVGTYELLDESLTKPSLGAERKGLMIGLTDCRSQEDKDTFSTWYRDVHAADVLKAGFHQTAYRCRNVESSDAPQFCALYETQMGGFEAFKALMLHYREHPSPVAAFCIVRNVWALEAV